MSQLNVAWDIVLADLQGRGSPPSSEHPVATRPPSSNECDICGWRPARPITLRRTTGLLIIWRWARSTNVLCRRCGSAWYAESQAHSLVKGWWGIVAPIANVVNMTRNRIAISAHRRMLDDPRERAPEVVSLFQTPMPFRSPWRRTSSVMATLLAAVIAGSLATAWVHSPGLGAGSDTGVQTRSTIQAPLPPTGLGGCVDSSGHVVWCSSPNAYWRLENTASATQDCANLGYEESMTDETTGQIYCASRVQ